MTVPKEKSLEGWVPQIGADLTLERVIDLAFDYRGNTTVVKKDGSRLVGYISNRDGAASEPFVQIFDERGNGPIRLLYSEIANIHFTGRDPAAGKSWVAWMARKGKGQRQGETG